MGPGKFALELAISSKEAGRLLLALPCLALPRLYLALPCPAVPLFCRGGWHQARTVKGPLPCTQSCSVSLTLHTVPSSAVLSIRTACCWWLLLTAAAAHYAAVPSSLIARNSIDVARSQCVEFSLTRICFDACNFLALIRARRGTQLHAGPLLTRRRGISRVSGWSLAALPCLHLGWPLLVYIHTHTRVCVCRHVSPVLAASYAQSAFPAYLGPIFFFFCAHPRKSSPTHPVRPRRLTDNIICPSSHRDSCLPNSAFSPLHPSVTPSPPSLNPSYPQSRPVLLAYSCWLVGSCWLQLDCNPSSPWLPSKWPV
ncbi:hypothetical protein K456DRAFT_1208022 [Colletotrichum gloeosporioides 23]|nr:hypothetical protein K456DRAFT_1208022 [Colletotrichum gloeosporioides 23]